MKNDTIMAPTERRERLPNRRLSETFDFEFARHTEVKR
jgi:hypothetical protein